MITDVKHSLDEMWHGLIADLEDLIKFPDEADVQRRANEQFKKLKEAVRGYPQRMTDAFLLSIIAELCRSGGKHTKEGRMKVFGMIIEIIAENAKKTRPF